MAATSQAASDEQLRPVVPEDDSFHGHQRSDSPWWNESAYFGFLIPERKIDAYFYMWHRPNMKLTAAGVALWDPYGEEKHNCLHYDWYDFNELRDGSDMFDFQIGNGMTCELLEPLKQYKLHYASKLCDIDLIWEGVIPPQQLYFDKKKGFEQFGGFHYEQLGHVTGTVRVEGETLDVDCHHFRDRSWGIRPRHRDHPGGGVDMGWASDRTAFCTTLVRTEPFADVMALKVDRAGYGYFIKDGELGVIASAERRVLERRPDGRPLHIVLDLKDERGREMHAEGRTENNMKYDELWFVHWGLVNWTIDNEQGWGETQDWFHQDLIRAHQRAVIKDAGAAEH